MGLLHVENESGKMMMRLTWGHVDNCEASVILLEVRVKRQRQLKCSYVPRFFISNC